MQAAAQQSRPIHFQTRLRWNYFLLITLLVRLAHLLASDAAYSGMNPKLATEAKALLMDGFGQAFIDVPPGPVLMLASGSAVVQQPPGLLIPAVVLFSHLALAAAFYGWIRSLALPAAVEWTSLLLFVFMPIFNSYEGVDNFPVIMAAAAFFATSAAWRQILARGPAPLRVLVLAIAAWIMAVFRAEYLLFVPLYFAVVFLLRVGFRRTVSRREVAWAATACICLLGGALSGMLFNWLESDRFALAPREYACWAFLDGMPAAWLSGEDHAESDRVVRGIERFGHPEDYDYSLARIIRAHPGDTLLKCLLNVPRWLFHLGRRHVAAPLPVAILALWGWIAASKRRSSWPAAGDVLPDVLGVILMTLPLVLLIVYARYMIPAYGAMCVLAATGLLLVVEAFLPFAGRYLSCSPRSLWTVAVIATVVLLECLLVRGGGLLPDADALRPVVAQVDRWFATRQVAIVMDPYNKVIDASSGAHIRNRWLDYQRGRPEHAFEYHGQHDPLAAATSPQADKAGVKNAVVWFPAGEPDGRVQGRLAEWQSAGFEVVEVATVHRTGHHSFRLFWLERP